MVVLFITIYALMGDDIRIMCFEDIRVDDIFLAGTLISMLFFAMEIGLSCVAKPEYRNSFFFWLDVISTISLLTDVEAFMDAMMGGSNDGADAVAIARASRGARIGTRAGRFARVIRLIRLIRIVKLYK